MRDPFDREGYQVCFQYMSGLHCLHLSSIYLLITFWLCAYLLQKLTHFGLKIKKCQLIHLKLLTSILMIDFLLNLTILFFVNSSVILLIYNKLDQLIYFNLLFQFAKCSLLCLDILIQVL